MRRLCLILGVAAGIVSAFWLSMRPGLAESQRWKLDTNRRYLRGIARQLREFRRTNKRYPTNDEGLLTARNLVIACNWCKDRDLFGCHVTAGGIRSEWGDPFIYENRRGLSRSLFGGSGADHDPKRLWSIRVDDGVYVWSVGARRAVGDHGARMRRDLLIGVGCAFAAAGLLFVYVILIRRHARVGRGLFAMVALDLASMVGILLLVGVIFPTFVRSCYVPAFTWRPRQLKGDYLRVLARYRDDGVISNAAYDKLTKSADDFSPGNE